MLAKRTKKQRRAEDDLFGGMKVLDTDQHIAELTAAVVKQRDEIAALQNELKNRSDVLQLAREASNRDLQAKLDAEHQLQYLSTVSKAMVDLVTTMGKTSLARFAEDHRVWSLKTFGAGYSTGRIIKHIEKELREIAADPADLVEWIDVIMLAMDGYWRNGGQPEELMNRLREKLKIVMARKYVVPEDPDGPIEHDRSGA